MFGCAVVGTLFVVLVGYSPRLAGYVVLATVAVLLIVNFVADLLGPRTRSRALLQEIVEERGRGLRSLPYDVLEQMVGEPAEFITVESCPAMIGIVVEGQESPDMLRVVVQGSLKGRWLPRWLPLAYVAADGFYKCRDGDVSPLPWHELQSYD